MERKIGSRFKADDGTNLKTVEAVDCKGCYYNTTIPCDARNTVCGFCSSSYRNDNKSVKYIIVRKYIRRNKS